VANGQQAGWGGIMICAKTDAEAAAWMQDMKWFWDTWAMPFGQGLPELLVGSPDTISRRLDQVLKILPQDEVVLLIPQGVHDRGQILTSLELMASKVMPRLAD
jgi:alkanesulfonate monooxygenase SsuD/methylene tetrahydromethanopterin reductase-like flavin-dependent oxidoreductase (luciferase family)